MTAIIGFAVSAALALGPAMQLEPVLASSGATIRITNSRGRVVTRVFCPQSTWLDARDAAGMLMTSTEVMAAVIATDGRLNRLDQLGPVRYICVFQSV